MGWRAQHRFDSLQNFLRLPIKEDGTPYAPELYKELVKECYIISKNTNTSYTDLMNITPTEKHYILSFIKEEFEQAQKLREEQKAKFEQSQRR